MSRRVVMFDMDGVLANFLDGYREVERAMGKPETHSARWDAYWDKDVWAHIKSSPTFWVQLPTLVSKGTLERIADLQYAADVYFVTARPGVDTKLQTQRWLENRNVYSPAVVVTPKKGEMARAINANFSIEDKAGNAVFIAYYAEKTKSFLLDTPHNQFDHDVLGSNVTRIKTVNEYLDAVVKEV